MSEATERTALLYGLGAVALWSTVATAFELALAVLSPLELIWMATVVSWALLGGILAWRGELHQVKTGWKTAAWAGLMNPVAYYLVLFEAYDRLPGQEAMAINYTWALTMAWLAIPILGQRLRPVDAVASLLSYFGVWIIATRGDVLNVAFADPVGVGLAVVSTVIWALYWLLSKRDERAPIAGQWQNFTVGAGVLTVLMALGPGFRAFPASALLAGAYVGCFELGIAFVLWLMAMKTTQNTARISTLIFLSPPVSLTLLAWVAGEPIERSTPVALVFILGGLGIQQWVGGEPLPTEETSR